MADPLARARARHAGTEPFGQCGECHVTWPCRTWLDLETPEERGAREAAERAALEAYENDPDAQIRDVLTGDDAHDYIEDMATTILAVLDLHKRNPVADRQPYCDQCVGGYEGVHEWPCPTIRTIAKALGIRVPGA